MEYLNNILQFSDHEIASHITAISIKAVKVIAIFITSRMLKRFTDRSIKNVCKLRNIDYHTCMLLRKSVRYSITILAAILILQNLGVEVSPLIAAMGISGVAVSFGLKDIIANIIAGIFIMVYQQFKVGDHIKIKDWEGKITDINIRYTTLQSDNMTVFVPNSILYTTTVAVIEPESN